MKELAVNCSIFFFCFVTSHAAKSSILWRTAVMTTPRWTWQAMANRSHRRRSTAPMACQQALELGKACQTSQAKRRKTIKRRTPTSNKEENKGQEKILLENKVTEYQSLFFFQLPAEYLNWLIVLGLYGLLFICTRDSAFMFNQRNVGLIQTQRGIGQIFRRANWGTFHSGCKATNYP